MKILIADDHVLVLEGIALFLRDYRPDAQILRAHNFQETIVAIQAHRDLELMLLDLVMPGMQGALSIAQIRRTAPATPLVVLSGFIDPYKVRAAMQAGAQGFMPKTLSRREMQDALDHVLAGETFFPADVVFELAGQCPEQAVLADRPLGEALTPRQQEILNLIAEGMTNKEISRKLTLSAATVRTHLSEIFRKLGVKNRTEAARQVLSGMIRSE